MKIRELVLGILSIFLFTPLQSQNITHNGDGSAVICNDDGGTVLYIYEEAEGRPFVAITNGAGEGNATYDTGEQDKILLAAAKGKTYVPEAKDKHKYHPGSAINQESSPQNEDTNKKKGLWERVKSVFRVGKKSKGKGKKGNSFMDDCEVEILEWMGSLGNTGGSNGKESYPPIIRCDRERPGGPIVIKTDKNPGPTINRLRAEIRRFR